MLPGLLLAAATWLLLTGPVVPGRLGDVVPVVPGTAHAAAPGARPAPAGRSLPRGVTGPRLACVLAGAAVALLVGGGPGLVVGAGLALGGPRLLARLEPRDDRRRREELERDLPLALDLLSACLAGGAPLHAAVTAVAGALPGECGQRLSRVATALDVGSPPAEAWSALVAGAPGTGGPGLRGSAGGRGVGGTGLGGSAARALVRSGESGAPVAAAVARLAADVRAESRSRAEQAAKRAGVVAVAPLGLCFLPAFVLLGIVPVVVGLAAPLLRSF